IDGATDGYAGADSTVPPVSEGLLAIDDLTYVGGFRIASDMYGASTPDYSGGALGYRPDHDSLYMVGFEPDSMIGEFAIPSPLGMGTTAAELPAIDTALQGFQPVMDNAAGGNPQSLDRVTGMLWVDGDLVVNTNVYYDAGGEMTDTTLIVRGGQLDGTIDGYFRLEGGTLGAGYMAAIPEDLRAAFGGPALVGWASNYAIVSRYSVGPSLFAFDPGALVAAAPGGSATIATTMHMGFPYGDDIYLAPDALEYQCGVEDDMVTTVCEPGAVASDLWNFISRGVYAFIVPGTRTFAVFGSLGGSRSGIGYKITQDDDNLCGGPCARGADDYDNYYWFFDVDDILAAESPSAPAPYAYGSWDVPFGGDGDHLIIGGTYAPETGRLYLSLAGAGQVGDYDRPPVIVVYEM
ncbi:MAG: hypothetical protein JRH11_14930, partial [Deltaproteobacteria bacterium]|nr:hypothetical protein [Deltaproteobacteria bacterium]